MMEYIKVNEKGHIGIITLDNDSKLNSLNFDMLDEINEAIEEFEKFKKRVIIIRSNERAKVWCAGLRIDQLPNPDKDPVPFEYQLEKTLGKVENFEGAVIAMIEGSVWGGGCELAFACDILIGSSNSTFAITPAKLNAPYNPVQVQRVLSLVETNIAKELFFTASPIKAERALELGILNHIIEPENIEQFTFEMAGKISLNAPQSIKLLKKEINAISRSHIKNLNNITEIRELIKELYYSEDFKEGKRAFLEKRVPEFKGK
jgi:methylmalonyl-CoA decarboxylase